MSDRRAERRPPELDRPGGERMRMLAAAGDELQGDELLRLALEHAVAGLGGLGGMVHLCENGHAVLCLAASSGLPPGLTREWRRIGWDDHAAPMRAVREGGVVWQTADGGPDVRSGSGSRAWNFPVGGGILAVPLIASSGAVGTLCVLTAGPGEPSAEGRAFLRMLVEWLVERLEVSGALVAVGQKEEIAARSRGKAGRMVSAAWQSWDNTPVTNQPAVSWATAAGERAAARRTARMRELTAALAEAITVQDVVNAVADRVLPPFGATGLIILFVEGDHLRPAGAIGYDPDFIDDICHFPMTDKYPIPLTIRERAPLFISSTAEYLGYFPHLADVPVRGRKNAWALLPLIVSGHAFGVCVISFDQAREFSGEERSLLTALSGLLAQTLERARLFDAEHNRAQELQHALLPRTLPSVPAVTAAARYLPAGKDMEVGGDWYDVIPLSSERVALVIGDVMGHGFTEAAMMGRLRTAVHTLADLELPPDELLTHLNDLVIDLGDDFYATCLYAVYDPTTRVCAFSTAGHPPPLIVHPDGTVRVVQARPNPLLGAATPPFDVVETQVPEGTLLALYTDGLVEAPGRDIDQGIACLAEILADGARRAPGRHRDPSRTRRGDGDPARQDDFLESLCDAVTAALMPPGHASPDDAALLVARTNVLDDDVASWDLPEDPRAAGQARSLVREQLAAWDLDGLAMTTELLVSELIGNVVRHARGPIQLRLLRSRCLICEVSDGSLTVPRIRRASDTDEGGRGLQLVAALSQRWGTRYTATGKCIWTEQSLSAL
ncbi:SpoIIE family protein phosphatase [Thermopolyspora sp. NPDC052614]|uniref:SpoIIE family protein phosphatase n=1 Tax=Thermopolyspora sp. NPDC052614 TaxID=3155682 RepID=UPI003440CEE9